MSNNRYITLLASSARTVLQSVEVPFDGGDNPEALVFSWDVTVDPSSASLTPSIQSYDDASDTWTTILTGAAKAATGFYQLKMGPHLVAAANLVAKIEIGARIRYLIAVNDSDSMTYSVGVEVINK